ncbi:hypothetical protein HYX11_00400 [Candidatus Woesearchaeota archaeon]|nr:hypothetical protein [Candidatus Woesearchaeota archaeon]
MFGLTFKQLAYAILFLPIALALLLKTPFAMPYRVALALIPSSIACIFMFTNLPKKGMNWFKWLQWKEFHLMDKKMVCA